MPYPGAEKLFPSPYTYPSSSADEVPMMWDKRGDRYFMHGIDRGVVYIPGKPALPWNGLSNVEEASNSGASVHYRDGRIFLTAAEAGDYSGKVSALFFPDELSECLGIVESAPGFYIDNQKPRAFGFAYRSLIGSGLTGDMFGYQIHLVYNVIASIGTRQHKTLTDQVQLDEFAFDLVATPIHVKGFRPSAHYIIDTRNMDPAAVQTLEQTLYGNGQTPGSLPTAQELYDFLTFNSGITFVDNGDGTWTALGSSSNITVEDDIWTISNVNGTDHGDGTFTLVDTP